MSTGVDLLPKSAYVDNWTEEERAVAEFVGFTAEVDDPEGGKKVVVAPLGVRSAYLATLQRTGLDPVARQIYLILFNGKWTIHVSIDGLRLTAERGKEYLGQAEPEWWYGEYTKVPHLVDGKVVPLPDGGVLLKDEPVWHKVPKAGVQPTAARVGVFKKGRKKATYGIATWEAYGKNYGQWKKNGPHMLAKCAEALALRKAFPMELGGLYLEDEFADGQAPAEAELEGGRDWEAEIAATKTVEELTKLYEELKANGWTKRLDALARARRAAIIAGETEDVVDAELVPEDAQ
mgnify:CR=1 FL=1